MRRSLPRMLGWTFGLVATSVAASPVGLLNDGDLDPSFQDGGTFAYETPSLGGRAAAVAPDGRLLIGYTYIFSGTDTDMRFLPVLDQGATTHCGSYFPDLGGTQEDVLNDIAVFGSTIFLAGRAAGPPADPQSKSAVGAINLSTCLPADFGGPDGSIASSAYPLDAATIVATPAGGVRVAAMSGAGDDRILFAYGLDDEGDGDGGFDPTYLDFSVALGTSFFEPRDMVRQPDGKLVIVGTVELENGDRDVGVMRLTSAGGPDTQFSLDGLASFSYDFPDQGDDEANAVALMNDGRIVVGGSDSAGTETYAAVAVLTSTGGFFNAFGAFGRYRFNYQDGIILSDSVNGLATQGDGKIVVAGGAGFASTAKWGIARLHASGDTPLDTSFSLDGRRTLAFSLGGTNNASAYDLTLGQGGLISVVGSATTDGWLAVAAARLWNAYIFADGFESGSRYYWEAIQP